MTHLFLFPEDDDQVTLRKIKDTENYFEGNQLGYYRSEVLRELLKFARERFIKADWGLFNSKPHPDRYTKYNQMVNAILTTQSYSLSSTRTLLYVIGEDIKSAKSQNFSQFQKIGNKVSELRTQILASQTNQLQRLVLTCCLLVPVMFWFNSWLGLLVTLLIGVGYVDASYIALTQPLICEYVESISPLLEQASNLCHRLYWSLVSIGKRSAPGLERAVGLAGKTSDQVMDVWENKLGAKPP
jgi:hypothetical protein